MKTVGSLFAGIGGFDLGFERAGFQTRWLSEWNEWNQAVLADRFPTAKLYGDINRIEPAELEPVHVICGGFPCTNISISGNLRRGGQPGLHGEASGLFFKAMEIIGCLRPRWVVIENVPQLLYSQNGRDFAQVLLSLRDCGYDAAWRVLNSAGFGVPQNRRRLFLVAGLGRTITDEFISDAAPVESIPCSLGALGHIRKEAEFSTSTLQAPIANCRLFMGSEPLVCERGRRGQMVERQRIATDTGLPLGVDDYTATERFSAGNAVSPQIAEWIAQLIAKTDAETGD